MNLIVSSQPTWICLFPNTVEKVRATLLGQSQKQTYDIVIEGKSKKKFDCTKEKSVSVTSFLGFLLCVCYVSAIEIREVSYDLEGSDSLP